MHRDFQRVGRDLYVLGLVTANGGNLSIRAGERIVITRHGAMLGRCRPGDLIETGIEEDGSGTGASMELVVHRAIYRKTSALAVVHAHPPAAILLSLISPAVVPADTEGGHLLGCVPVISATETVGSAEAAELIGEALMNSAAVLLRGHGSFAIGRELDEALCLTSALEASCRILALGRALGEDLGPCGPRGPGR